MGNANGRIPTAFVDTAAGWAQKRDAKLEVFKGSLPISRVAHHGLRQAGKVGLVRAFRALFQSEGGAEERWLLAQSRDWGIKLINEQLTHFTAVSQWGVLDQQNRRGRHRRCLSACRKGLLQAIAGTIPVFRPWASPTPGPRKANFLATVESLNSVTTVRLNMKSKPALILTAASFVVALISPCEAAGKKVTLTKPAFIKGDPIPAGATHDWNLGATGCRGWMFSDKRSTADAREIRITEVAKGSPADGVLAAGDVILGVAGKPFAHDPRTEFGKALVVAESEAGGGSLPLTRWRGGKTEEVMVKLPILGTYSATAPYACPKSQRILEQGCEVLAKRVADPSYKQNPIVRSLNALALLASGDPRYLSLVKKEAEWAAGYSTDAMATWYYGYVIMLLAEYEMATGDHSVMSGLRRLALEAANGQSIVGSWGHRFAGPDGRLVGYGMMNAPGVPLTISLVMARAAGVDDPKIAEAIERSARLLRFYAGKGCVPYGDHAPWMQAHDDNGKNGMAAVLFNLLDEPQRAEYFSRMCVASHGAERDEGHTGNFCNMLWSMPGVAQSGPQASGAWMNEFGAWYYDLARRWDGSFIHQGPPETVHDKYQGWDCSGGYLLAYAMPLKKIWLTGKRPSKVTQVAAATAQQLVRDGRGWSHKDPHGAYDKLSGDQLFERLDSWSPIVRERAAIALSRRDGTPVPALVKLLESPRLESRLGACQALAQLKTKAAPAVPALRNTLHAEDLWLRINAAEALAAIGAAAMPALPELLEMLAKGPTWDDPRNIQQRYLTFALFNKRGGLIGNSLEGVDRELLFKAVRAGLQNEDGRARGSFVTVYDNLTHDEIKPLLPAVLRAVVEPAPSGIMFADGIRMEGLHILVKHRVPEGINACVEWVRTQNHWHGPDRTVQLMKILLEYGAAAKPAIAELKKIADSLENDEKNHLRKQFPKQAEAIRNTIRENIPALEAL